MTLSLRKCQQLCDIDDHCLMHLSFHFGMHPKNPTRYDFEANKKNNLIFYGLPSDPRETPNSLVTKVEHMSFADLQIFKHSFGLVWFEGLNNLMTKLEKMTTC